MKNFDTNDYILVIVTAILVLLALSSCSQKQLNPNELPDGTRFQTLEDSDSYFLKAKGNSHIGISYAYLPDRDYFMVMVVSGVPIDRIYLDEGMSIDVHYFSKVDGNVAVLRRDVFRKFAETSYLKANGHKYRMRGLARIEAERMLIVSK